MKATIHIRHVHQMEFKHRNWQPKEGFQEYEDEVARLARLSFPEAADDSLEQLSSDQFVSGIRCLEIKQTGCLSYSSCRRIDHGAEVSRLRGDSNWFQTAKTSSYSWNSGERSLRHQRREKGRHHQRKTVDTAETSKRRIFREMLGLHLQSA